MRPANKLQTLAMNVLKLNAVRLSGSFKVRIKHVQFDKRSLSFSKFKEKVETNKYFKIISAPFNKWWFRRTLRAVQVAVLTFMVYQTGYQRGVVSYSKDPEKFETEMMHMVLGPAGNDNSYSIHAHESEIHRRVNRVATRILKSAKEHCHNEVSILQAAVDELTKQYKEVATYEVKVDLDNAKEKLQFWQNAYSKLHGKWGVVVSNHPTANAFVTGFCPRKIFVHEGLLTSINPSDDELGMILGHEISHVILGHTDEEIPSSAILLGAELIIMSLVDPIGIGTFLFDLYLNKVRQYIAAKYSRSNEDEADALGIQIAGRACFNLVKGVHVFKKLADIDLRTETDWSDSHPASIERYQRLALVSKQFEANDGYTSACKKMKSDARLAGILGWWA